MLWLLAFVFLCDYSIAYVEVQTCMQVQIHVDATKGRQTKLMIRDAETRRSAHAGGGNV
jgi:hypothetical protein